jgi:hypothetical protein
MIIAVDFDGTIVKHRYPKIGGKKYFAFETLKALQKQGHKIILWTFRSGKKLDEAVNFCKQNGVEFYAVNKSSPEELQGSKNLSPKINADVFIDDRNFGGFPGWDIIYRKLCRNVSSKEKKNFLDTYKRKKILFGCFDKLLQLVSL